jgi:hypothetical protein
MAITKIRGSQIHDLAIGNTHLADGAITGGSQFAATVDLAGKTLAGDFAVTGQVSSAVDPTAPEHLVRKGFLDAQLASIEAGVSNLGSAFRYRGIVAGGADAANAVDLEASLTEREAGDYYKVGTSGHFKIGAAGATFFANANDGLVWNTVSGVDVIDNTNATVAGTADEIDVSGTADTGFTVALSQTVKDQIAAASSEAAFVANVASLQVRETPAGVIDGANSVFTLSQTPVESTVQVFLNGLLQEEAEDYTLSGTSVTLTLTPLAGDRVKVIYFKAA